MESLMRYDLSEEKDDLTYKIFGVKLIILHPLMLHTEAKTSCIYKTVAANWSISLRWRTKAFVSKDHDYI